MLNPFPSLLVYTFFAPTLLRLAAAGIFLYLVWFHTKHHPDIAKELSPILSRGVAKAVVPVYIILELAIGLGLLLGFWTQIAALLGAIVFLKVLFIRSKLHTLAPLSRSTYIVVMIICLSLLLTGAGALAFDLPL